MKRILFAMLLTLPVMFVAAQGKWKNKPKTKQKPESTIQVTVPPPGDQSRYPEVNPKQKPQIYHSQDTVKPQQNGSDGDPADMKQQPVKQGDSQTQISAGSASSVDGKPQPQSSGNNKSKKDSSAANSSVFTDNDVKQQKEEWKKKEKDRTQHEGANRKEKKAADMSRGSVEPIKGKANVTERKNIPARVNTTFEKDFPGVQKSVWTKREDYWTVEFVFNGVRQTATYKSNGERIN